VRRDKPVAVSNEQAQATPPQVESSQGESAEGGAPEDGTTENGSPDDGATEGQKADDNVIVASVAESGVAANSASRPQRAAPLRSRTVHHGSPFAPSAVPAPAPKSMAAAPSYPQNAAASGGAIASFCLGIMSLAIALIFWRVPAVALVISLLGLCMGIWGMYSNRRGFAGVGLFLCIAAFGLSSYLGVVQLYVAIHGVSPFGQEITDDFPIE